MARRRRNTRKKQEDTIVDIVEVSDKAQDFFESNQKYIIGGILLAVLIIGGLFFYNNMYKAPKQMEAIDQMAYAQRQFEQDSFSLALTNPGGGFGGFLDIIDQYSGTNSGNIAKYYAGLCYLNLGDFDNALTYLKDFSPAGEVTPIMKYGNIGDVYSEQNNFAEAKSYYQKAINAGENELLTAYYMKKLGLVLEKEGDSKGSLDLFQNIKDKYPSSAISQDIDKYIERVK